MYLCANKDRISYYCCRYYSYCKWIKYSLLSNYCVNIVSYLNQKAQIATKTWSHSIGKKTKLSFILFILLLYILFTWCSNGCMHRSFVLKEYSFQPNQVFLKSNFHLSYCSQLYRQLYCSIEFYIIFLISCRPLVTMCEKVPYIFSKNILNRRIRSSIKRGKVCFKFFYRFYNIHLSQIKNVKSGITPKFLFLQ